MSTELVAYQPPETAVLASMDFMPMFDMAKAIQRRDMLVEYVQKLMNKDIDYGSPSGTGKPSLLKPGAEKLCTFFGLVPEFITTEQTEDWTGAKHGGEPFFYYRYKCRLTRNGRPLGEGEGSCNTWESKYRYRWVSEAHATLNGFDTKHLVKRGGTITEFAFAVNKGETGGKYGKPAEYWQMFRDAITNETARRTQRDIKGKPEPAWEIDSIEVRVPNPDVADQVNTCQKMAQKRALVAAVLISVNASEYFTQDVEDLEPIEQGTRHASKPTDYEHDEPPPVQRSASVRTEGKSHQIAPDVPPPVAEMYKEMLQKGGISRVFQTLLGDMADAAGETDGGKMYTETLREFGVQSFSQFKSMQKAQQCVLALYNKLANLGSTEAIEAEAVPA